MQNFRQNPPKPIRAANENTAGDISGHPLSFVAALGVLAGMMTFASSPYLLALAIYAAKPSASPQARPAVQTALSDSCHELLKRGAPKRHTHAPLTSSRPQRSCP